MNSSTYLNLNKCAPTTCIWFEAFLVSVANCHPGRLGEASLCCVPAVHSFDSGYLLIPATLTCKQIARFTLQPNEVLTARGWRPRSLNNLEKDCVSAIRGRSSATTTQVLTLDKSSPRAYKQGQCHCISLCHGKDYQGAHSRDGKGKQTFISPEGISLDHSTMTEPWPSFILSFHRDPREQASRKYRNKYAIQR